MIQIKRVYEPAERKDGRRILVERLWPRGINKENLKMDAWAKEAAPSADLRRWFNHDPEKWKEFEKRYRAELTKNPEAWKPLVEAAQSGDVTLLFSAHDTEHNNALVLKNYLEERCKRTAARKSKARK
ncbi:MAG TPA: DUF488 domain-containing protein [Verrucomicrobiae bacterium]|nr:DUF488 domain-containing protein [Verrucomicrobiae bacterium]